MRQWAAAEKCAANSSRNPGHRTKRVIEEIIQFEDHRRRRGNVQSKRGPRTIEIEIGNRAIESHDFVIHGSSHLQSERKVGTTCVINPGEACGWIHGKCTAAILDTETGEVENISL